LVGKKDSRGRRGKAKLAHISALGDIFRVGEEDRRMHGVRQKKATTIENNVGDFGRKENDPTTWEGLG